MPPATHRPALDIDTDVVVDVFSTEHHPVSGPERPCCPRHRITGVSAVPGHRQPVLTDLITDGERRVFSRVPQTRSQPTLDLIANTRHTAMQLIFSEPVGLYLFSCVFAVFFFLFVHAICFQYSVQQCIVRKLTRRDHLHAFQA